MFCREFMFEVWCFGMWEWAL